MLTAPSSYRQRQLFLALLLFVFSQLTLALHSHDLSLHTTDSEECTICLLTSSSNPAPVSDTPDPSFLVANTSLLSVFTLLASQPQQTPLQPRAPPHS